MHVTSLDQNKSPNHKLLSKISKGHRKWHTNIFNIKNIWNTLFLWQAWRWQWSNTTNAVGNMTTKHSRCRMSKFHLYYIEHTFFYDHKAIFKPNVLSTIQNVISDIALVFIVILKTSISWFRAVRAKLCRKVVLQEQDWALML